MKFAEAVAIINEEPPGFMVFFEHVRGGFLHGDYFPEKWAGEALIPTESEAWDLAARFAAKTRGKYVNIYVVGSNFRPVVGYEAKKITNR